MGLDHLRPEFNVAGPRFGASVRCSRLGLHKKVTHTALGGL